ncbi:MAG TPA: hypothetical protein VJT75_08560 [Thermoleophilaceae bacterium]|nr:hypothetical protein [Thermoleophilaceae bacterium]
MYSNAVRPVRFRATDGGVASGVELPPVPMIRGVGVPASAKGENG